MDILVPILIVVATTLAMELVANLTHKYIMHGPGWGWHKSHHEAHDDAVERNDLYAVVFALLSMALFALGTWVWAPLWWVAVGLCCYGLIYFVLHDGLVHQRWPFRYVPRKGYLRRVYQAHRMHHAARGKDGAVSFGFVFVKPVDKLKAEFKARQGYVVDPSDVSAEASGRGHNPSRETGAAR